MDISLLLKIAGIGILVAVISQVLAKSGREEMAMVTALTGLVIVLMLVVNLLNDLFTTVRTVFMLT